MTAKNQTFTVAQPAPDSAIDVLREIVEYETKSAIELEALTGDEMPELPWMAKAEAVLAAQPPAAPVEIPGLTIDAIHKQTLRMHPADQHKLAEMIAANVGYELTPEPPHPDCPHEHSSAETSDAGCAKALIEPWTVETSKCPHCLCSPLHCNCGVYSNAKEAP